MWNDIKESSWLVRITFLAAAVSVAGLVMTIYFANQTHNSLLETERSYSETLRLLHECTR